MLSLYVFRYLHLLWKPQRLSGASSLHRGNVPGLQSKTPKRLKHEFLMSYMSRKHSRLWGHMDTMTHPPFLSFSSAVIYLLIVFSDQLKKYENCPVQLPFAWSDIIRSYDLSDQTIKSLNVLCSHVYKMKSLKFSLLMLQPETFWQFLLINLLNITL